MIRQSNTNSGRVKRKRILIIIAAIIALIIAVFLILKGCTGALDMDVNDYVPTYLEDDRGSAEGEAETASREEVLKELEKQQLVVTDKLSSNITFMSGETGTVGEWIVENPEENTVIQQAEVYLEDILIVKSTPIYPNQHITGVSLLTDLEAGEYEVTAYLNYYDIETKEFISKAGYRIHLTVR